MPRQRGQARQDLGPERRSRGFRTPRASPGPVQGHDHVALDLGDEPVRAFGERSSPVPQRSRVTGVDDHLPRPRGRRDDHLPRLTASDGGVRQELDPAGSLERLPQLYQSLVHESQVPLVGVGEARGGAKHGDEGYVVLVRSLDGVLQRVVMHRTLSGLNPEQDVPATRVDALEVEPAEPLGSNLGCDGRDLDLGGERGSPGQGGSLVRLRPRALLIRQSRHVST
mmetsp:Transcript_5056/g.20790  ORF Transcript_5056/g.20790 Transcript_5056/m.20790 type:complete len:225 (+) Transcript_5056:2595-3269(+)